MINRYFSAMCLSIILTHAVQKSYSQSEAIITYAYTSYGGYKTDMKLYIKNDKSQFIFHTDKTTLTNEEGAEFYHYYTHYEDFYDFRKGKMTEKRVLEDSTKLLSDWDNDLKWKITDETKVIAGFKVQKAIAESHDTAGRGDWDYGDAIAWFTIDIPFSTGPERYCGLPGLIVELGFAKRTNITYTIKSISYVSVNSIVLPTKGIRVGKEEILRPKLINRKWLKNARDLLLNDN
jgi:GLPGLI family protein